MQNNNTLALYEKYNDGFNHQFTTKWLFLTIEILVIALQTIFVISWEN